MTDLLEALSRASAPDRDSHRPEFFRLALSDDRAKLEDLLKREPRVVVHDTLHSQLTELVRSLNPSLKYTKDELDHAAQAHLKGTPSAQYGVWVYYPWSFDLVHLLDEAEFSLVRTDRNRNKITSEEQAVLATKKVGVIGLSVGQSVSLTMALERSFGEIRLADFDTLELSNLNRIRSGVHEMGIPKVINTAREIAELDPFLKVTIYPEGITKNNLHAFFTEGGQLDVLIEECDSVDIKILARQKAKELGIPVVMDMSDRGCLDVERFDLEPDRPIMHGWIDHLDLEAAARPMTNEEKIPYMLPIVGTSTLSPRLKASVMELGESLSTWPQLATSVVLGGALAGDTYRRILLDGFRASGRWFVDLEEIIAEPAMNDERTASSSEKTTVGPISGHIAEAIDLFKTLGAKAIPMDPEIAMQIAEAGALAPSAGNCQPWKFELADGRLLLLQDVERSHSKWDPDHLIAHIALGTCLENMVLKTQQLELNAKVRLLPFPTLPYLVASLELATATDTDVEDDRYAHFASHIGARVTNRKLSIKKRIEQEVVRSFHHAARSIPGCDLLLFQDEDELRELGEICGGAERIRVLDPDGHREFFEKELRWTKTEVFESGDGLDIATLEPSPSDEAAFRIASDPLAIALLNKWKGGRSLERFSKKALDSASAVALVTISNGDVTSRLNGGRAAQRVWIEANRNNIGVHPISAPVFLFHALPFLDDLAEDHKRTLRSLQSRFSALVPEHKGIPLFMMRLAHNGEPSARSLRRPTVSMFSLAKPIKASTPWNSSIA